MTKHPHYDVIIAWAEGAEVQVFRHEYDGYYWEDTATPNFNIDFDYRIKPAEKLPLTDVNDWVSKPHREDITRAEEVSAHKLKEKNND